MSHVLDELPESLKIGYADWTVDTESTAPVSEETIVFGLCEKATHTIKYFRGYNDNHLRNTVLHEVLHAIWDAHGLSDEEPEETVVSSLANGLQAVLRDNPEFAVWFVNHMCESADDA